MRLSWPQQEAIFNNRVDRSYWRMMIFLLTHKTQVKREAWERYCYGYKHFGDNMFHRSGPQLKQERLEEGADLLAYQIADDERCGRD